MSLTDRLAQARRGRSGTAPEAGVDANAARARRGAPEDPFTELKRAVHASLLESLGPQLYDSRLSEEELESRVRVTLQEVLLAHQCLARRRNEHLVTGLGILGLAELLGQQSRHG